jgi:hypothetical protein
MERLAAAQAEPCDRHLQKKKGTNRNFGNGEMILGQIRSNEG